MKIRSLEAFHVPVALRKPIRHASNIRHRNDTLIVRCELSNGSTGWGEGLPRPYVTAETIETAWQHLEHTEISQLGDRDYAEPHDAVAAMHGFRLADVRPAADSIAREGFGNSVRCAVELALLDATCRAVESPISQALRGLPAARTLKIERHDVRYSGVVTTAERAVSQYRAALRMRLFGFHQVKVKVGAAGIDDAAFLKRVRRIVGQRVDLRVDANESWLADDVVAKLRQLDVFDISSLEQPVAHRDVETLAEIRKDISVPIMLDESLCCMADAERAIRADNCDLFNLRISKCGGLVNCVQLAALAGKHGLGYQLGCLVGETGILSAAGRHFACSIDRILYVEGSYDRFVVRDAFTLENLTFGYGGRAQTLDGFGLGINVQEQKIRQHARRSLRLI